MRLPPGGEGIDYPFDPNNMQTTVWFDGEPSGLWAWEYVPYFAPGPRAVAVIGDGPDIHRAQWEEEANRVFPLPEVVPIEPGQVNNVMVWALWEEAALPDGSGTVYTILDAIPLLIAESETWNRVTPHCYYTNWERSADDPTPFLFGWVDWTDYEPVPESSEPDPVTPRIAFELILTSDGGRIAAVDPSTMTCS